jgi:hypothetical protein
MVFTTPHYLFCFGLAAVQITIMDLIGKVLSKYNTGKPAISIPAASQTGMYLLKIVNGNNSYIEKIVIR